MRRSEGPAIGGIAVGLAIVGIAGFFLGWGSSLVHVLGVLVVMLLLFLWLRRRNVRR